jgi:hypothetical protein
MATPWDDPIKATKQLTVFPTSNVTGGAWDSVFNNALAEFNKLSKAHKLGVTLTKSQTPPSSNGPGAADVQFDAVNGTVTFTALGTAFSLTLNGNDLHGDTQVIKQSFTGPGGTTPLRVAKAFIFVPSTPQTSPPNNRIVGDPVKLCIAVHELIHACGLANSDHSSVANADVFFGIPSLRDRVNPKDDRLVVGNPGKELPPIVLNPATVKVIQANWK